MLPRVLHTSTSTSNRRWKKSVSASCLQKKMCDKSLKNEFEEILGTTYDAQYASEVASGASPGMAAAKAERIVQEAVASALGAPAEEHKPEAPAAIPNLSGAPITTVSDTDPNRTPRIPNKSRRIVGSSQCVPGTGSSLATAPPQTSPRSLSASHEPRAETDAQEQESSIAFT